MKEIVNGTIQQGSYYTNNLADGAADPFILEHEGKYYLYCTGGSRFTVRISDDLINWSSQPEPIITLEELGCAKENGWAPEMYKYNGKFYFIFSAKGFNGIHSIYLTVCDTPNGKFVPVNKDGKPFYAPEYSVIDASLLFDDDGRIYLYYSKDNSTNYIGDKRVSQTYAIELTSDLTATIGEPVFISTPEYPWELKSGSVIWNEGPVVFKKDGTYYLLYSANYYVSEHYSVGYATSDTPLRFFDKKEDSRILSGNGTTVTGPGHCNILRSPDGTEMYIVYHVHTVPPTTAKGRSIAIDKMVFLPDGSLAVDGPSEVRRPLPSGVNGFYHINSGYECSLEGDIVLQDAECGKEYLFDGLANTASTRIAAFKNGGSAHISFAKAQDMVSLWLYPSSCADYLPGSAEVLINGEYLIKGSFGGVAGNPLVISLSNIPDGVKVENVKVTLYAAEGKECAALSEIIMIKKK